MDGMLIQIFQKSWHIIGEDITWEALNIFNDGEDVGKWNNNLNPYSQNQEAKVSKGFSPDQRLHHYL